MQRLASIAMVMLAIGGCGGEEDDGESAARAAEAEQAFVRFGEGRYHVITWSADPERAVVIDDEFGLDSRLVEVPFVARVRFTSELWVRSRESWRALVGDREWTPERLYEEAQAYQLFGQGRHAFGEELDVEGAAMFERLERGWRYRCLDAIR